MPAILETTVSAMEVLPWELTNAESDCCADTSLMGAAVDEGLVIVGQLLIVWLRTPG
jgi:hypothetical protein